MCSSGTVPAVRPFGRFRSVKQLSEVDVLQLAGRKSESTPGLFLIATAFSRPAEWVKSLHGALCEVETETQIEQAAAGRCPEGVVSAGVPDRPKMVRAQGRRLGWS